jgi:hypothetical protein
MATFTDAKRLAAHQRQRAQRIYKSIEAASQSAAIIARDEAIKLTSGNVKQATLTAAGHPFARRRGLGGRVGMRGGRSVMASYPLTPINAQTGSLRRSWRIFRRPHGKGSVGFVMQNVSPHAIAIRPGGSRRVVDRRFFAELNKRTLPKIRKRNLDLWRAALKG